MSKKCPNCLEILDDNYTFCANCGSRLIGNPMADNEPSLNIGDGNAISGGVNIDTSKHVTSHDTHYHSTIIERTKCEAELKLEATNQLRRKTEEIISERGRIDSVALAQLRLLSLQLGIDEEIFKSIIKDVRSNRNGGNTGLGAANARYLQQAQQAVQTNDMDALSNLTPRLEAMAAISHEDNVQYLYYLTLSLLYPIKSMEVYERLTDENYWRTFWAIISYVRTGKYAEATKVLALFEPSRFEKSEDDQNLLEAYSNIMMDDKDAAQEFLDEILGEPSEQVKPLLRAIESRLYEEEVDDLEVRFYSERILSKSDIALKSIQKSDTLLEAFEENKQIENNSGVNPQADSLYAEASTASGVKRVMLLQKAAEFGSTDAMYELADAYIDGDGVKKNEMLAVKWLTKAADLGHVRATACLGAIYLNGSDGVDQNYVLAEKYLKVAAEKEFSDAQVALANLYLILSDWSQGLVWVRRAVQSENIDACALLGEIYEYGYGEGQGGVTADKFEAIKWYEKAAMKGHAQSQYQLANLFQSIEDYNKCISYLNMAAAQNQVDAIVKLAYCYEGGYCGCMVDLNRAEELMTKAAEMGDLAASDWLNSYHERLSNEIAMLTPVSTVPTEPYITIDNVWVDTDGVGVLYFHCDWTAYNLKSKCMQIRLNLAAKTGKKVKYDASLNEYYFLKDRLVIKNNVEKFENVVLGVDQYDLRIDHDEEKELEFTVELVEHATGERYQITKKMTISVWWYFNIFSSSKFEVRSQQIEL